MHHPSLSKHYYLSTFVSSWVTCIAIRSFSLMAAKYDRYSFLYVGIIGSLLLSTVWANLLFSASISAFFIAQILFALTIGMIIGPFCSYFSSLFPTGVRCSSISICLNSASALFGGTTPLLIAYFFSQTAKPLLNSTLFLLSSSLLALFYLSAMKGYVYDQQQTVSDYT